MMFWRKAPGCLMPASPEAENALLKIKLDTIVEADPKQKRNLQLLRLYWATMEKIAENQTHYPDAKAVDAAFKVACGHCDWIETSKGLVGIPRSISFASMDQIEFDVFWNKALRYCCEQVIPGLDGERLRAEVMDMVTDHRYDQPAPQHQGLVEDSQTDFNAGMDAAWNLAASFSNHQHPSDPASPPTGSQTSRESQAIGDFPLSPKGGSPGILDVDALRTRAFAEAKKGRESFNSWLNHQTPEAGAALMAVSAKLRHTVREADGDLRG